MDAFHSGWSLKSNRIVCVEQRREDTAPLAAKAKVEKILL